MCEFCLKHGEGEKWYLQAKNYSDDLLSDIRRRKFIEEFADPEAMARGIRAFDRIERTPKFIRGWIRRITTQRMKKIHFGQVAPIEDIEKIFGFVNSIVRVACICRKITLGKEKRYCYGISMAPNGGKLGEILRDNSMGLAPYASGFESLKKAEALAAFREHELDGLCHSVWTFHTPFIGGICNCDRSDCLAMRATLTHATPVMFRSEYVAAVDNDACTGCRECMRVCQFGGITYSASNKKTVIDKKWCYGCGICRSVCTWDAIRLEDRAITPVASELW